jgi:PAS domain S-box-containing protein
MDLELEIRRLTEALELARLDTKRAEDDARRSRERLELALRGSKACTWDFELPDGTLATSRQTLTNVYEILGYTSLDDTSHFPDALAALLPSEGQAQFVEDVQTHLESTAREWEHQHRVKHKDGSDRWHFARGVTQREPVTGRATRLTGITIDITDIKLIEEELSRAREVAESANRAKDEFLANVSHEIRTPMNAILGMTELALDGAETAHQRHLLSTSRAATRNLLHIINDLLDYSRIAVGKLGLDRSEMSLRSAIDDTVRALAARAHRKGLELVCNIHWDVPDTVIGDTGRIRQVLMNLVGNAIKFTDSGEVVVEVMLDAAASATDPDAALKFVVRDTGVGIAPEKHASIFRAFEQADASTTRRFGGTGLGLTISAQLAALMDGLITVESEPGRGSTFTFTARLPRSARADSRGVAPTFEHDVSVLVIDDNETSRHTLMQWLSRWNMKAVAASDAASALAAASRAPSSVVLLDARMPGIDVVALGAQLRDRLGPAGRLVLLTSGADPAVTTDIGADASVLKPVVPAELLEAIAADDSGGDREEKPVPVASPRGPGLHILVAEDNELNVTLIRELLDRRGHRVEVAGDGQRTLELALNPSAAYDLMLLDLHMPEKDGFQVVRELRAHERTTGKRLPLIAVTARSSERDRDEALAAGMDDFLCKPIDVAALFAAIERIAATIAPGRALHSPLLDPAAIRLMCGGDSTILVKLCEVFQRTLPEQMKRARAALVDQDLGSLRDAAQMVNGTLSAFSKVAATLASSLENDALREDLESCTALMTRLDVMCAELVETTRGLTLESLR